MIKDKYSKRYKEHKNSYSAFQADTIDNAVSILRQTSNRVKFNETIDICLRLPLDARKDVIKSYIRFPNNFRQESSDRSSIVFFCDSKDAPSLEKYGVKILDENSFAEIKAGNIAFKSCYCFSDYLPKLIPLARFLGPKGLMPNVKFGTVIERADLEDTFSDSARISFKMSSDSTIKISVGKVNMSQEQIVENIKHFVNLLQTLKPAAVKFFYLKNFYISTTMGCSISVNIRDI